MGVDPSLIASSLNSVVAQRLARRLCLECRSPYTARADELGLSNGDDAASEIVLYSAVGCAKCHGTGYSGRIALREVMTVEGEVRTLVERSAAEIFDAAVRQGMTTIRDDGMRVALSGISSIEEIRRVTGIRLN
jgi:type II secretory ATPase GspE/PulE/Tfp pilus assembly ATPase PilB-like protein